MVELIKVSKSEGGKEVVSARDMYNYLRIKTRFDKWMNRMIEYGFTELIDYQRLVNFDQMQNGGVREVLNDFVITLDMAKHIAMIQRTNEGKQLRQYFIDRENELRKIEQSKVPMLPQTYIEALEKLIESEKAKLLLETTIEEQKPKVAFADSLSVSNDSILIGELAKLMTQSGYVIGQNRLFDKLRTMGYLAKIGERRNMPNQKYVEMGLFEIKTTTIITSDGHTKIRQTPKVTAKGQIYFINKVNKTLGRL